MYNKIGLRNDGKRGEGDLIEFNGILKDWKLIL